MKAGASHENARLSMLYYKGESQSLLRICGICLFVTLTQTNAQNAIDISSIYDPTEEHNIVSR